LRVRSFRRNERGQALVEMALVLPLLLLILMAILQFGEMYNVYNNLTDAARVGARTLSIQRNVADPCTPAIAATQRAVAGDLPGGPLPAADIATTFASATSPPTVPVPDVCGSGGAGGNEVQNDTATVTITYHYTLKVFGVGLFGFNLTPSASDAIE
jgi:Flp pilus assembly protein TadG